MELKQKTRTLLGNTVRTETGLSCNSLKGGSREYWERFCAPIITQIIADVRNDTNEEMISLPFQLGHVSMTLFLLQQTMPQPSF